MDEKKKTEISEKIVASLQNLSPQEKSILLAMGEMNSKFQFLSFLIQPEEPCDIPQEELGNTSSKPY